MNYNALFFIIFCNLFSGVYAVVVSAPAPTAVKPSTTTPTPSATSTQITQGTQTQQVSKATSQIKKQPIIDRSGR